MAGLVNATAFSPLVGLGVLVGAVLLYLYVRSQPSGNEAMAAASASTAAGARALLGEAAKVLGLGSLVILFLLVWQAAPSAALAFGWGALLGAACCAASLAAALSSGIRVAQAAREAGERGAAGLVFFGAAVPGLGAFGAAILGVGAVWLFARGPAAPAHFVALALGTSCAALLARGSGGLYERAADVASDLLSRVEPGLAEADAHNPAQTAHVAGELAGTAAGVPAEALECCAGAVAAAVVLAGAGPLTPDRLARMAFPVAVLAAAGLASAVGVACTAGLHRVQGKGALRAGAAAASLVFLLAAAGLARGFRLPAGAAVAVLFGLAGAVGVGLTTQGYASRRGVARIASASQLGPAQNVISGFALGLEAAAVPVLVVGACLVAAGLAGGLYGVGLAAVGAASAAGLAGTLTAAGALGAQARRVAERGDLGGSALEAAKAAEAEGEVAATLGDGLRTAAAAFGGLAWVGAYAVAGGRTGIDLGHAKALMGVLLGAAVPFFVCSSALMSVGDVALEIVGSVRRWLHKHAEAEPRGAHAPAVRAVPRKLVVPGLVGLVVPVAVGFGLGAEALGGLLAGAVGTGILLSLFLQNVGDAWQGTRRQIEAGAMGGRGSEAHRAAVVGDTLGEPLKDAAVPVILTVLKVLAVAGVIVAPLLP